VEITNGTVYPVCNLTEGTQFHPGEKLVGELHVHLGQDAEENVVYVFTITVTVKQWNVP